MSKPIKSDQSVLMNSALKSGIRVDTIFFILNIVIRLVTIPYLIDILGVEYYGIYIQISSLIMFCTLLDLGLGVYAVKKISSFSFKEQFSCLNSKIISTLNYSQFIIALIFLFVAIIFSWLIDDYLIKITPKVIELDHIRTFIYISWLNIILKIIFAIPRFILKGRNNLFLTNLLENIENIFPIVLGCFLMLFIKNIALLSVSSLLISLLVNLIMLYRAKVDYNYNVLEVKFHLSQFKEAFQYSYKFHLSKIIYLSKTQLIPFFIGSYFGAINLARFNVYNRLFQLPITAISKISLNLIPTLSNSFSNNKLRSKRQIEVLSIFICCVLILFVTGSYLFVNNIIKIWIGNDFKLFNPHILILLIIVSCVQILSGFYGLILQSNGQYKWLPELTFIELIIFLISIKIIDENLSLNSFLLTLSITAIPSLVYSIFLIGTSRLFSILPIIVFKFIIALMFLAIKSDCWILDVLNYLLLITSFIIGLVLWKKSKKAGVFAL